MCNPPHPLTPGGSPPELQSPGASPLSLGESEMTERIRNFLRERRDDGPCLVVDLDVVRENYQAFAKALPDSRQGS